MIGLDHSPICMYLNVDASGLTSSAPTTGNSKRTTQNAFTAGYHTKSRKHAFSRARQSLDSYYGDGQRAPAPIALFTLVCPRKK